MPELPEVEACRYNLEKFCLHGVIIRVEVHDQGEHPRNGLFDDIVYENIGPDSPQKYTTALSNKRINGVYRKGKHMWLSLTNDVACNDIISHYDACMFHFGMTGSIVIKDHFKPVYQSFQIDSQWPPRFTKLQLVILSEENIEYHVCFTDARRLGSICLRNVPWNSYPIVSLAVDMTIESIPTPTEIYDKLSLRSRTIKSALLDQEYLFSGIGNWIADEVLYQSCVHPETKSDCITIDVVTRIIGKLHDILLKAISCLRNGQPYPVEWLFNYRWEKRKKNSLTELKMPNGQIINFIDVGGRTSAIVPAVQEKPILNKVISSKNYV